MTIWLITLTTSGTVHAKDKPEHIKGIYVSAWVSGTTSKFPKLVKQVNNTELNTMVIDIKDAAGRTYHQMNRNMVRSVQTLHDNDIYAIARIVVFYDPVFAKKYPQYAVIDNRNGKLWKDGRGTGWLSPYNKEIWKYNVDLAKEALEIGFDEIQWDYVRFPDTPMTKKKYEVMNGADDRTRSEVIAEFLTYAKHELGDVRMTADVFGIVTTKRDDAGIGQHWETLLPVVDALHPMVYPSHYARGSFGIRNPNGSPYTVINTAITQAVKRSPGQTQKIIPWLQAFTLGKPVYTEYHIREQIRGAADAGVEQYILWSASNKYQLK